MNYYAFINMHKVDRYAFVAPIHCTTFFTRSARQLSLTTTRPLPCAVRTSLQMTFRNHSHARIPSKIALTVAATALALSLSTETISPIHTNSLTFKPPVSHAEKLTPKIDQSTDATNLPVTFDPTTLSKEDQQRLREQSKKNGRAAGQIAQKFSFAKRAGDAGDLESAFEAYNEIIQASPEFAPAYSNRGNIYVARKQYDAGRKDYDRCIQLAPLNGDAWVVYVNRGAISLVTGDSTAALADMEVANKLRGNNEIILANRAGVYEVLGKWDNASRDYLAAIKDNEIRPFWLRYGLVLFQRNMIFESQSILKRVATRYDVGELHAALAVIYFDQGDVGSAETEWSKVDRPRLFESRDFLVSQRKWPPRMLDAMDNFRRLKE